MIRRVTRREQGNNKATPPADRRMKIEHQGGRSRHWRVSVGFFAGRIGDRCATLTIVKVNDR